MSAEGVLPGEEVGKKSVDGVAATSGIITGENVEIFGVGCGLEAIGFFEPGEILHAPITPVANNRDKDISLSRLKRVERCIVGNLTV
jgi:hypothetical protein